MCIIKITTALALFAGIALANQAMAEPSNSLIDQTVIEKIRAFVETDIVRRSIEEQNVKYGDMTENDILRLDDLWRKETKSNDQPLIAATLSNPLSSYLTRIQAHSEGLYTEIFVMDKNGLNVGQSSISSDYWQGDEAKFKKTFPLGAEAVFIDDPEYDKDTGAWKTQVNLSISDKDRTKPVGAITVEVNISELERRSTRK